MSEDIRWNEIPAGMEAELSLALTVQFLYSGELFGVSRHYRVRESAQGFPAHTICICHLSDQPSRPTNPPR